MMPYAALWCEENIWRRVEALAGDLAGRHVVFISNASRSVACWSQRAARAGEPVIWDYHVVLLSLGPSSGSSSGASVTDPDCTAGEVLPFASWRRATFPLGDRVASELRPRFRVAPAAAYLSDFRSDRAHMRGPDGAWLAPPPPWEAPWPDAPGGSTLGAWWDVVRDDPSRGITCDLEGLERFAAS
jgi:hypothetical protein